MHLDLPLHRHHQVQNPDEEEAVVAAKQQVMQRFLAKPADVKPQGCRSGR
jgi:hypothetical protein